MRFIYLFEFVQLASGFVRDNNGNELNRDLTKDDYMNIHYRDEIFGMGVHIYNSFVITLASIAVLDSSKLKAISLVTQEEYQIQDKMMHKDYASSNFNKQYNIAVLKINYRSSQMDIKLDFFDFAARSDFDVTFSGWSWNDEIISKLIYVTAEAKIKSKSTCRNLLGIRFNSSVELCASSDQKHILNNAIPGSPLFIHLPSESYLIGLLSWSYENDDRDLPAVFVEISAVYQWIWQTVRHMYTQNKLKQNYLEKSNQNFKP